MFVQPEAGSTNTKATPSFRMPSSLAIGDPTTIVLPLIETEAPNSGFESGFWLSSAVSLAIWVRFAQPEVDSLNT